MADEIAYEKSIAEYQNSKSTTSSSQSTTTPSTRSSTSTLEEREDKTDPNNFMKFGNEDMTDADKNGYVY
jgi:hypothetical protein